MSSARLRCATCGKATRSRNAFILQGWYSGTGGAKYCSWACTQAAPKPKGRGRPVFVRFTVPDGCTSKDVDRWREHATKVFAELAVKTMLAEQERAAAAPAVSSSGEPREFRIADYDQVLALWKSSDGIVLGDADKRPAIGAYLRRNPGTSFVWEANGLAVGALLAGHDGRRGLLHHLAVAPGHRRHGVGRALVEHALAALAKQRIDKVHLMVLPSNTAARAFWKSLGWVERRDVLLMSRAASGKPGA